MKTIDFWATLITGLLSLVIIPLHACSIVKSFSFMSAITNDKLDVNKNHCHKTVTQKLTVFQTWSCFCTGMTLYFVLYNCIVFFHKIHTSLRLLLSYEHQISRYTDFSLTNLTNEHFKHCSTHFESDKITCGLRERMSQFCQWFRMMILVVISV